MRIGITTFATDGGRSGIGRYVIHLLSELAALGSGHEFDVVGAEDDRALFERTEPGWTWIGVPRRWCGPAANLAWHQFGLARIARARGWDAVFIPAGNRRLPYSMPCPVIGTVHDLSSLHVRSKYSFLRDVWVRRLLPRFIGRLDGVITISRSSRDDVVDCVQFPESRLVIIPQAHDVAEGVVPDRDAAAGRIRENRGIDGPFLLYVSRIEHPGKNHARLIRAFERVQGRLPEGCRLVFVGADWDRAEEVHRVAARSSARDAILFAGFASQEELRDLYSCARGFVFPSLYEGFGIPILEAMAREIPVACSNTSSMPEVAGDAAILFDPEDVDAIGEALRVIATDDPSRQELIARGRNRIRHFSWKKTAERTLAFIEAMAVTERRRGRRAAVPAPAVP